MTRRLEAGPLLVTLGALLLLVSLFLTWFTGEITAWEAFEVWDVVLFVLALGTIAAGVGLTTQDVDVTDRRFLPAAAAVVAVIAASQILDPPPAAAGQDPDVGAWLALGAGLIMCAGALLTFGRVHLALTVEGREPHRQHVAAVDARGPADPTTDNVPAVKPAERDRAAGARLFGRERDTEPAAPVAKAERAASPAARQAPAGGNEPPEQKQD
jgi:hypothetical protein